MVHPGRQAGPARPPFDAFDGRPAEPAAYLHTASSIATKIKLLRDDLARYERSLEATNAALEPLIADWLQRPRAVGRRFDETYRAE